MSNLRRTVCGYYDGVKHFEIFRTVRGSRVRWRLLRGPHWSIEDYRTLRGAKATMEAICWSKRILWKVEYLPE